MIVELPRGLEIDLDNIPDDLEEQVQRCIAERWVLPFMGEKERY